MLSSAALAHAASAERVQRLANFEKSYKAAKKMADLLKQAEPTLSFEDYQFLHQSMESGRLQNEKPPTLRRKGPAEFEYEMRGTIVNVRWDEEDRLVVNRQVVNVSDERRAEDIYRKVMAVLPKKSAAHPLQELLLPRAEATIDMIATALGLITTLNDLFQRNAACPNANERVQECLGKLREFDPEIRLPVGPGGRRTAGDDHFFHRGGKIRCPGGAGDVIKEIGTTQNELEGLERNIGAQITCRPKLDIMKNCIESLKCSLLGCGASPEMIRRNSTVGEVSAASCQSLLARLRRNAAPSRPLNNNGAPLDLRPPSQQDSRR